MKNKSPASGRISMSSDHGLTQTTRASELTLICGEQELVLSTLAKYRRGFHMSLTQTTLICGEQKLVVPLPNTGEVTM